MNRKMFLFSLLVAWICFWSVGSNAVAAKMPPEDIIDVLPIGDGLCVSNVFQKNMVIQRDKPINIWGWADPGALVTVSFQDHSAETTAKSDRSWEVTLKALPANSNPQTITVKSKGKMLKLDNILIGDVWVLGGQSNMEFPIANVDDGQLEIASANFPAVRLLTMPWGRGFNSVRSFERLYEWSDWSKRHFRKGDWDVCSPETVQEFSAIGLVFGRRLQMATQVPIGLIDTSRGGTTVESWTPRGVLNKIEGRETKELMKNWQDKIDGYDFETAEKAPGPWYLNYGPRYDKNCPGYCYAGVIKPLEGLSVKGAVFHQGYNNCLNGSAGARMYYQVFGKMISTWRNEFNDPQLPFCIISLCTSKDPQTCENFAEMMYDVGPLIREAQYKTFRDFYDAGDRNIGFVSSFDFRKSWYHPQIKVPVGERTAKWALASQYGILKGDEYWLPPAIKEVKIEKGQIQLHMSTSIKTKDESDGKMLGFAIAGKDKIFYPAEINYYTDGTRDKQNRPNYQDDILVLASPFVPEPVHYRYAWARNPLANLTNSKCIPIATQRNDDWILEETPVKVEGFENKSSGQVSNELRKILKEADVERRYNEALLTVEQLKPLVEKANASKEKKK